jgi:hypothetical protein
VTVAESDPESDPATDVPEDEPADGPLEENDGAFPQKQPGGWYLLSDGSKVHGKGAAISGQAALEVAAEAVG